MTVVIEQHVVGDILFSRWQLLFDDRVTTLTDVDDKAVVHIRTYIAVLCSDHGKGEQAIELRQYASIELQLRHPFAEGEHQFLINAVLNDLDAFFRGLYLLFVLLELVGDVTFGIDECLLADPLRRYLFLVGVTHLEVIAEDVVITDLQARDARRFYLALLNVQKVVLAIRLDSAQFVQFGVHAASDDVRASLCQWRVRNNLPFDTGAHLYAGIKFFAQHAEIGIVARLVADSLNGFDCSECPAELHHLAWADTTR